MANKKAKAKDALTQAYNELRSTRSAKTEISLGGLSFDDFMQGVVEDMEAESLEEDPRPCPLQELKRFVMRETLCRLTEAWIEAQDQTALGDDVPDTRRPDDEPSGVADDMRTLVVLVMIELNGRPEDQRILQAMVDVEYDPTGKPNHKKNVEISKRVNRPIGDVENAKKRIRRLALPIRNHLRRRRGEK